MICRCCLGEFDKLDENDLCQDCLDELNTDPTDYDEEDYDDEREYD